MAINSSTHLPDSATPHPPLPALSLCGISKSFGGVSAVIDFSCSAREGCITSLIGPNGAGKTTVINIIAGLIKPDAGDIHLFGQSITGLGSDSIARLGLGRTFQECKIFQQLSVLDNIMLGLVQPDHETIRAAIFGYRKGDCSHKKVIEASLHLLEENGLISKKDQMAGELSFGERKLLELTRAFAKKPRILLLDEPMAGLHPAVIAVMSESILRLRDAGISIFIIDHNLQVILRISDHIVVMNSGSKIAEGTSNSVRNNPEVIRAYFGKGSPYVP